MKLEIEQDEAGVFWISKIMFFIMVMTGLGTTVLHIVSGVDGLGIKC